MTNANLNKIRQEEIISSLSELSTTELISKRSDLRYSLNQSSAEMMDRDQISEITLAITRELGKREEKHLSDSGNSSKDVTMKHLKAAKEARLQNTADINKNKHSQELERFNRLSFTQKELYLRKNPNPHDIKPEEFQRVPSQ